MSGHNKWSKIKHKKAATDAERSRIFSKHARLIAIASRAAGGDVTSPGLAVAITRAKQDAMPKDNIERAVTKGLGSDSAGLTSVLFECYGPGGVALLIVAVTDNNNRTNQEIKHALSKAGYQLGAPGSAAWAFTKTDEGYTPTTPQTIDDSTSKALTELILTLHELPDVTDIYTTADQPKI